MITYKLESDLAVTPPEHGRQKVHALINQNGQKYTIHVVLNVTVEGQYRYIVCLFLAV